MSPNVKHLNKPGIKKELEKYVQYRVLFRGVLFSCLVEARCCMVEARCRMVEARCRRVEAWCRMVEARSVLHVREARCCMLEDRFRIVEAHGVLAFLPSAYIYILFRLQSVLSSSNALKKLEYGVHQGIYKLNNRTLPILV